VTEIPFAVSQLRSALQDIYGVRLRQMLLYGSFARGDEVEGSDMDVAVVLGGPVEPGREIDRMMDAIYRINLACDTLLSVYPVSEAEFRTLRSPLLLNIRREGVAA
jgi:predicted nucleotidyltransferase